MIADLEDRILSTLAGGNGLGRIALASLLVEDRMRVAMAIDRLKARGLVAFKFDRWFATLLGEREAVRLLRAELARVRGAA